MTAKATTPTTVYFDPHEYDGRGKIVKTWSTSGLSDIASDYWNAIFDGIGTLTGVGRKRNGNPTADVNEVDALGNVLKRISDSTISPQWKHVDYSVVGDQIQTIERPAYIVDGGDTSATRFKTEFGSPDVNGNQGPEDHIVYRVQVSPPSGQIALFNVIPTVGHYFSRTTYGIDNKLRYAQKTSYEPTGKVTVFTEYRYDALGRRVLTRSRRSTPCNESAYECQSTIDRFIWDGDQLIAESRGNGADTQSEASLNLDGGTGLLRGWVRYTHAGGIDEPLAVWSNNAGVDGIVPHFSWRGNVEAGTDIMTGALLEGGSTPWVWPTRYKDIYLAPETRGIMPEPTRWLGSLTENQIDFNGLAYRRNRYYNTTTGRFTQEDPIGLAGGLNLYGFANGDPVNFSDPFGLCPMCIPIAIGVIEGASAIYDIFQTYRAFRRGASEGASSLQATLLGAIAPGPGHLWQRAANSLDALSAAAGVSKTGGLTAAGHALTKHAIGQRAGSRLFPALRGNPAEINAAAQSLVDDILTSPGASFQGISRGKWMGGFEVWSPSGRGVRYNSQGEFVTFLERGGR